MTTFFILLGIIAVLFLISCLSYQYLGWDDFISMIAGCGVIVTIFIMIVGSFAPFRGFDETYYVAEVEYLEKYNHFLVSCPELNYFVPSQSLSLMNKNKVVIEKSIPINLYGVRMTAISSITLKPNMELPVDN